MNYFFSIMWISIVLITIAFIQIYIQLQFQDDSFYNISVAQVKCTNLPVGQQLKLCVYCLNTQHIYLNKYLKSPIQFTTSLISKQSSLINFKSKYLKAMNIHKENDLFCEEYLQFVDTQKIITQKNKISFDQNQAAKNLLGFIQAESKDISHIRYLGANQVFQMQSINVKNHLIYQIIETYPQNTPLLSIKYFSKISLTRVFSFTLKVAVFMALLISCILYYNQIARQCEQRHLKYISMIILSVLLYSLLYYHINIQPNNLFILPLCWAIFIWMCLTKIDAVDIEQYQSSLLLKISLSFMTGLGFYLSQKTGKNIYLGIFFCIFLFAYLIGYRIIYRIKNLGNYSLKNQTLHILMFICLIFIFLCQSLIIEYIFSFRFVRQIQILRYGFLLFSPIIMLTIVYFQNQEKVQNFEEYMEVQGSVPSIVDDNQLQEKQTN